jgi:hypothetical protein
MIEPGSKSASTSVLAQPVDSELSRGTRMRVFLPRVAADR